MRWLSAPGRCITLLVLVAGCASSTGPELSATALPEGEGSLSQAALLATHPVGNVSAVLSLTGRPHGVAIAANGRFCISQIDANSITCGTLTSSSATLGASATVGGAPAHVALNSEGTVAFTANQYGNSMSVVSTATQQLLKTVPLTDGGFNVLASSTTKRVYVTTAAGVLHVIDQPTRTVLATVQVGAAANGLALDETRGRLYVSSIAAGTITAVNTSSNTIARTYQVSGMPQRIALSLDRKTLYIASESVGLEALNLESGARVTVPGVSPGSVGLAITPDGKQLYVTNPPMGRLQIVNVATWVSSITDAVWYPRNVAFGLNGAAAIVTDEFDKVWVIR